MHSRAISIFAFSHHYHSIFTRPSYSYPTVTYQLSNFGSSIFSRCVNVGSSYFHTSRLMPLIGSLDQGTSSTRFILFSSSGEVVDSHQVELPQIYTDGKTGWTEHDPMEIWRSTCECIETVMKRHKREEVTAIGITNQRETTVVWDKATGKPLHNAIVWHDSRTSDVVSEIIAKEGGGDVFRPIVGLPISTYFSAMKLHWILHKAPHLPPNLRRSLSSTLSQCIKNKTALFGTVDSWLIWCMTGGVNGGAHVTDVSNASRTLLMRLSDCKWDSTICKKLSIPLDMLPQIRSSSEIYGYMSTGPLKGVAVAGCLGDQQAALVGQLCLTPGTAKNTYGTGCFLLLNTGENVISSSKGLLTTVGYQLGPKSPIIYALEGSVAVAGAAVRWLRDEVHLISKVSELSEYAAQARYGRNILCSSVLWPTFSLL